MIHESIEIFSRDERTSNYKQVAVNIQQQEAILPNTFECSFLFAKHLFIVSIKRKKKKKIERERNEGLLLL